MRIKSGMEQAVCTLMLLARLPDHALLKSDAISERLEVSPSYLKKLMRLLVQAGLVDSIPGAKGGFKLAKRPEEITLYDVFLAVEGRGTLYQGRGVLPTVLACEQEHVADCVLHRVMKKAEHAWAQVLAEETLASFLVQVQTAYQPNPLTEMDEWIQSQLNREEDE
jgi:Rrf2 family protein